MGLHNWILFFILFGSLHADLFSLTKSTENTTVCNDYVNKQDSDEYGIALHIDFADAEVCSKLNASFTLSNPNDLAAKCNFTFTYDRKTVVYRYNGGNNTHIQSNGPLLLKLVKSGDRQKTNILIGEKELEFDGVHQCWNGSLIGEKVCYNLVIATTDSDCGIILNADARFMNTSFSNATDLTTASSTETENILNSWWIWVIAGVGVLLLLVIIGGLIWLVVRCRRGESDEDEDEDDAEKGTQTDADSEKTSNKSNSDNKPTSTKSENTEDPTSESKYIGTPPVAVSSHRVKKKKKEHKP